MRFRLLIVFLLVGLWSSVASAATIEQASRLNGALVMAIKVEGTIDPGDTDKLLIKLLDFYNIFGPQIKAIHLRSKGGDVDEAIKMGILIRRLRLITDAPYAELLKYSGEDIITVADKENSVCASACFLAYAGGVQRMGNVLALHRPFLPKEDANKISDLEYEAGEKQAMAKVRQYLQDMDIDSFFIDKMMSNSSKEAYLVTGNDVETYHLHEYSPAVQEILLSKCEGLVTDQQIGSVKLKNKDEIQKFMDGLDCADKQLTEIREEAFEREKNSVFFPNCAALDSRELQTLKTLEEKFKNTATLPAEESSLKGQLERKDFAFNRCKDPTLLHVIGESFKRQAADLKKMDMQDKAKTPSATGK